MATNLGAANAGQTAAGAHTVSITIPVGTDLLVVNGWGFGAAPTAATIAGNTMTATTNQTTTGTPNVTLYFYLSPPSGSQTLVITAIGATQTGALWSAYSGFNQTGQPEGTTTTNSGIGVTTLTFTETVVTVNAWQFLVTGDQVGDAVAGTGTTQRANNSSWGTGIYDSNGGLSTGSHSLIVNRPTSTMNIAGVITSFKPTVTPSTAFLTFF